MRTGKNGLDLIKSFEGCRLACYHLGDGVCTIGWGHTRPLNQCGGAGSWKISQGQADSFLVGDVVRYENAVNSYFSRSFTQNQFDALVSFAYNLGGGIFGQYNWNRNESDARILSLIPLYNMKGTQFEQGLTRRRNAECSLFRSGASNSVPNNNTQPSTGNAGKSIEALASDVQSGKLGNGQQRADALGKYATGVQAIVNERAKAITGEACHKILAQETLAGKYGDGDARKVTLGNYYNVVQAIINGSGNTSSKVTYTIRSGDSLSGIAAKYGTSVGQLQSWNGIGDPNKIYAGQTIRVK